MKKKTKVNQTTNSSSKKKVLRNYLLLLLLFVAFMGLVIYACQLYKVHEKEKMKTPIIDGMLNEIYPEDLDHYILDNPTIFIYMCTANGDTCRNFEKSFVKLLKKNDYKDKIVYLNLTDVDLDLFVEDFNNTYNYKTKLTTEYPAFVLYEDGEIKSILQEKKDKSVTLEKVKQFLELNEIGE